MAELQRHAGLLEAWCRRVGVLKAKTTAFGGALRNEQRYKCYQEWGPVVALLKARSLHFLSLLFNPLDQLPRSVQKCPAFCRELRERGLRMTDGPNGPTGTLD